MKLPSLWLETCDDDLTPRPALPGSTTVDVAIVGAGFTGLWTAHHLLRHDPEPPGRGDRARDRRLGGLRTQRRLVLGTVPRTVVEDRP